jgi:methionyl-tRNA formyltransferase
MKNIYHNLNLVIIGGNRLNEIYPLQSFFELKKKYNFLLTLLTENTHLKKKINNKYRNFMTFLKKKKQNYENIKDYNSLYKKIYELEKKGGKNIYLLVNSIFIIKKDIIKLIKGNLYNLHIGKLPEQRGAGITTWQIMSNIKKTAVTIHKVESGLDTGNIVVEKKINCKNIKIPEVFYKKISKSEKKVLDIFISKIAKNKKIKTIKQLNKNSVYMPRIDTKVHGYINWMWQAKDIVLFINAFDRPFAGARTFINGEKCILRNAVLLKSKIKFHPFQNGIVIKLIKDSYFVASQDGIIKTEVELVKNKKINYLGKRFFTPYRFIEISLSAIAKHMPKGVVIKNSIK